ncbi:MAG: hypothetical protein ACREF3_14840 [Acetobacteraceae bacterium]
MSDGGFSGEVRKVFRREIRGADHQAPREPIQLDQDRSGVKLVRQCHENIRTTEPLARVGKN